MQELELLIAAETIRDRIGELAEEIGRDFPGGDGAPPLWLIGALKGAFVFTSDLARTLRRECRIDFIEAKSYGQGTESSGEIRVLSEPAAELTGCDVLLVEDVLDTGRTAERLLAQLAARNPRTLRTVALLDKPSRRETDVRGDYVGFDIPNRFVVGYGMDYAERYRDLPDVRVLR